VAEEKTAETAFPNQTLPHNHLLISSELAGVLLKQLVTKFLGFTFAVVYFFTPK
jgi:hypothetical protein